MIAALADAGAVLERDDYLDAARGCADFLLTELRDADGRLLRTCKDGEAPAERLPRGPRLPARGAADALRGDLRAALVRAPRARSPTRSIERFADPEQRRLLRDLVRPRAATGAPQGPRGPPDPVGQLGGGATALLRLAALTGEHEYEQQAVGVLRLLHRAGAAPPAGVRAPAPGARLPPRARARGGAGRRRTSAPLERVVRGEFRPHVVLAGSAPGGGDAGAVPLLEGREPVDGRAGGVRLRALRLQGAGDRAERAGGAAGVSALLACLVCTAAGAVAEPPARGHDALRAARRVASLGPRPAAGGAERRAHAYVERVVREGRR